jgi:hypothetical protein
MRLLLSFLVIFTTYLMYEFLENKQDIRLVFKLGKLGNLMMRFGYFIETLDLVKKLFYTFSNIQIFRGYLSEDRLEAFNVYSLTDLG